MQGYPGPEPGERRVLITSPTPDGAALYLIPWLLLDASGEDIRHAWPERDLRFEPAESSEFAAALNVALDERGPLPTPAPGDLPYVAFPPAEQANSGGPRPRFDLVPGRVQDVSPGTVCRR